MKKILLIMICMLPVLFAQAQIGIKAGLNFANVTNASSINSSSRSGFHAGLFLAPPSRGVLGSRTEVIFSRQGYNYKTSTNTGNVNLDYILLPQFMAINITKYVQLQVGAQMAFLISATTDSTASNGSGNAAANSIMEYYNRFDYGYGGGIELHPFKGLLVGARVNISIGNLYEQPAAGQQPQQPFFIPKVDVKNNVFQIFAGWRFGSSGSKNKQQGAPSM